MSGKYYELLETDLIPSKNETLTFPSLQELEDFCDALIQEHLNLMGCLKQGQDQLTMHEFSDETCQAYLKEYIQPIFACLGLKENYCAFHKKPIALSMPLFELTMQLKNEANPFLLYEICKRYGIQKNQKNVLLKDAAVILENYDIRDIVPNIQSLLEDEVKPENEEVVVQKKEVLIPPTEELSPEGKSKIAGIKKIMVIQAVPTPEVEEEVETISESTALVATSLVSLSLMLEAEKMSSECDDNKEEVLDKMSDAHNFAKAQAICSKPEMMAEYDKLSEIVLEICKTARPI